jgi:peptidoglycan/LPS O-acetylase OafA/YrhL
LSGIIALGVYKKQYYLLFLSPIIFFIAYFQNLKLIMLLLVWLIGFMCYFVNFSKYQYGIAVLLSIYLSGMYVQHGIGFLYAQGSPVFYIYQSMCLLVLFIFFRGVLGKMRLFNLIGQYLARFSYTLYVIHFPLQLLAFSFFHKYLHHVNAWVLGGYLIGVSICIIIISRQAAKLFENKSYWALKLRELLRISGIRHAT